MSDNSLQTKYRPKKFEEVLGQHAVVKSLKTAVSRVAGHAFLLTGPSGTGKTTLARLTAAALGCGENVEEVNAATHTGVDDMREVTDGFQYLPLGGGKKAVIIDECHMLSKNAWNSMLKSIEDPPEWGFWFMCTTEPTKVPATIKTRCLSYDLKLVKEADIVELLDRVAEAEDLRVKGSVIELCAQEARGSPRQALSNLGVCLEASSGEEAAELLRAASENAQSIDLARALARGAGWSEVAEILRTLGETNPESVRHVVRAYFTSVALKATAPAKAGPAMAIVAAFNTPFNSSDGISPLAVACAAACGLLEPA